MRTNYVLSTWNGWRRHGDDTEYLWPHLDNLKRLSHSIDQITVVSPINPTEPPEYNKRLSKLQKPIVVLRRPNIGLSYGSWSYAFDMFGEKFDYYFFMEDDYHYVIDDFDKIMIRHYEEAQCEYLCWMVRGSHAGISCGLANSSALSRVKKKHGFLPYETKINPRHCPTDPKRGVYTSQGGQFKFSNAFASLADTQPFYRTPFWGSGGHLKDFNSEAKSYLYCPHQILDEVRSI